MNVRLAIALTTACIAAGCASYGGSGLRPGISTDGEVRAAMGVPAMEFATEDNGRQLVYPRGPLGTQTFMADVGGNGVLRAVRPVLNDDTFYRIQPGLTREQVLRMIGPPGDTMAFSRTGHQAWDYRYVDTWGYQAIFSVTFDRNGIVVSKITQRIERERGLR